MATETLTIDIRDSAEELLDSLTIEISTTEEISISTSRNHSGA